MTITNGYATLAEARAWMSVPDADTSADTIIEDIVESCSRWIDVYTGRHFYSVSTQARYFQAEDTAILFIDDLVSVDTSGFQTDDDGDRTYENTWATTDFDLMPSNANTKSEPYTWVEVAPQGSYSFPRYVKSIKITGTWGWPSVPDTIKRACLIQCSRIYNRKDAPFGVTGSDVFGNLQVAVGLDADVRQLLRGYKRAIR